MKVKRAVWIVWILSVLLGIFGTVSELPAQTKTPSSSTPEGLALFHRMQKALGGADRIAAIRDFDERVRAETWDANGRPLGPVRKRVRWIRPNLLRLDQVGGPGNTFTLYYDGRQGWEILPDQRVLPLVGGELRFAEKYLRNFQLKTLVADRDPDYIITSPAANVICIADKKSASHDIEITLDPASWLPIKNTSVSLADPAHLVPSETRFEEWEVVEGIRFARQASILRGGVRVARFTLERLELNRGLDAKDLARKPADLRPETR